MSKAMKSLHDLFVHELRDIFYAEKQVLKALPKMVRSATEPALKRAFETHRQETTQHVERLEKVFQELEVPARGVQCPAMDGILEEGEELMGGDHDPAVLDAALISAAQRVEHYEICAYGTLCTYAKQLGYTNAAKLLGQTLDNEEKTDVKLSELAETCVNAAAAVGSGA